MSRHPRRVVYVLAAAVLSALPAAPAAAAPADLSAPGDAHFDACGTPAPGKCIVRGVGDFNGDGLDDLVTENGGQAVVAGANVSVKRTFSVMYAPFGPDGADRKGAIKLSTVPAAVPVTVADVDADGRDDIVFVGQHLVPLARAGAPGAAGTRFQRVLRVSVVLGRPSGLIALDLHDGDRADVVVERVLEAGEQTASAGQGLFAAAAFGDFDADGTVDLALGFGAPNNRFITDTRGGSVPVNDLVANDVEVMHGVGAAPGRRTFTADLRITDLGACDQPLAGAGDVSGDGIADIVGRRCPGSGLPDGVWVQPGAAADAAAPGDGGTPAVVRIGTAGTASGAAFDPRGAAGDTTDVVPPPPPSPGRGYVGGAGGGGLNLIQPGDPVPLFVTDVDDDGTADIVHVFRGSAHVWLGGPDIAADALANRTDRIYLGAGFSELARTRAWRTGDLDGDGGPDLLLADALPVVAEGKPTAIVRSDERTRVPLRLFRGARAAADVIDLATETPDAQWAAPTQALWGMGDFNGDGAVDLLMADPAAARGSDVSIVHGPLTAR